MIALLLIPRSDPGLHNFGLRRPHSSLLSSGDFLIVLLQAHVCLGSAASRVPF
jgi:hypothetical protein